MKYELPQNNSLSSSIIKNLVFKEGNQSALTDVQYAALEVGVGRGESILVVSPTSTGKTQIALWAIASGIESLCNTVYLVTHRALAKQKFEDFKSQLLATFLDSNPSSLVIATGDSVEDSDGNIPAEPLRAPLLVATYEKYLAMLSAAGIPSDMRSTVVVCDEIQLIGDEHRGQNVEVLLTLLRNAGWKQLVGLSAVLKRKDAEDLSNWLGIKLVIQHTREKHLRYECWTEKGIAVASSAEPDDIKEGIPKPSGVGLTPLSILAALLKEKKPPVPIIVFCMRKQDTYDLARQFIDEYKKPAKGQLSLAFDGLPQTSANLFLAEALENRVASHNADLMDEERYVVEHYLLEGKIDVVFATSTLAAGVNFPIGAAIFANWERWDSGRRCRVPIDSTEFHNMAGRAGRMGFAHEQGRVIFIAQGGGNATYARKYLNLSELPSLEPRVATERFNQLALQLVASGLCASRKEVQALVVTTFSALREQDNNPTAFSQWPEKLHASIEELISERLILESTSGQLSATSVGKAIGYSGLLPETGIFLLNYVVNKLDRLISFLPTAKDSGDIARLSFLLFSACLACPEFRPYNGKQPTRFLPYPLDSSILFDADVYRDDLIEPVWHADVMPVNGAKLCCDWMNGEEIRQLELSLPNLSAGMLRDMYRNLVWVLQGLASIVKAASEDTQMPPAGRPKILGGKAASLERLAKLPRIMQRLSFRVSEGLPDDVLWITTLNTPGSEYRLTRSEILALREKCFTSPEKLMLGSKEADEARRKVFEKVKPSPQVKANWLRDACRNWKLNQRKRAAERQMKRARKCAQVGLIKEFYDATGSDFEEVFQNILSLLNIKFEKLDDKAKTGAPDYLVKLKDSPPLIIELKSKTGDKLVDYNKAVEVLAASEVHGHKSTFCVTLCQPGIDPSVPIVIAECGRLSVVESSDLGEALLRVCEGLLSHKQLYQWLASPGQALVTDLPYKEY